MSKEIREELDQLTHEELQVVRESICEGCKGDLWFWDSDCRDYCEDFAEQAAVEAAEKEKP